MKEIELLATILASAAHDVGHPGVTNRFLVNKRSKIAMKCKIYTDND